MEASAQTRRQPPRRRAGLAKASSWFVEALIQNTQIDMLVDGGCDATILSSTLYHEIPEEHRPALTPITWALTSVTGEPMSLLGEALKNIQLGDKEFIFPVVVADCEPCAAQSVC